MEYELRDKTREMKEIDLLHLTAEYVLFLIFSDLYIFLPIFINPQNVFIVPMSMLLLTKSCLKSH